MKRKIQSPVRDHKLKTVIVLMPHVWKLEHKERQTQRSEKGDTAITLQIDCTKESNEVGSIV
jgi:hypothetical protein